jgi:AcrR family transcriptional regulator
VWSDAGVPAAARSIKEEIVRAAERLFGERGLEGVSLRQIGAAVGNRNNSVVQYHFGSKDGLVQAIFDYRLPFVWEGQKLLTAQRRPDDVRSIVECLSLPILEQAEQDGSHYQSFVAMLHHHGRRDVIERLPDEYRAFVRAHLERLGTMLLHIPEPLRTHRVAEGMAMVVHLAADRERARANRQPLLPFAVHVSNVLDGIVGFLEAPVSPAALAALEGTDPKRLHAPRHL